MELDTAQWQSIYTHALAEGSGDPAWKTIPIHTLVSQ